MRVVWRIQRGQERFLSSRNIQLLGNHWPKLPTLANYDDNHLHELSHSRSSRQGTWCCQGKLTRRIWEGPKGERRCQPIICPTNLPESFALEPFLAERCMHHQEGPWVRPNMGQTRWLARDNPETNSITIKPETVSHMAEQFSWVPLPCCSPPWRPFPIKSFALSARVSPQTIHFWVLDKSPVLDPGRGPPSCNTVTGAIEK